MLTARDLASSSTSMSSSAAIARTTPTRSASRCPRSSNETAVLVVPAFAASTTWLQPRRIRDSRTSRPKGMSRIQGTMTAAAYGRLTCRLRYRTGVRYDRPPVAGYAAGVDNPQDGVDRRRPGVGNREEDVETSPLSVGRAWMAAEAR